jgi:putative 4-mercaptohistidine N1-methyltranferase
MAGINPYETDPLLSEYLLFHYGSAEEILPYGDGPTDALGFPVRCVRECVDLEGLSSAARGLDVGCAVGRASFELARYCGTVIGVDYSRRFVEAAETLRRAGRLRYDRVDEGLLVTPLVASVPPGVQRQRLVFRHGDAMNLPSDLAGFDVVIACNLICRLPDPGRFLERLPELVKPAGHLVITTPCTWLGEFTPPESWVGGYLENGRRKTTLDGLRERLDLAFHLEETKDLPFLIREHARKFQWSVAQASIWRRHA